MKAPTTIKVVLTTFPYPIRIPTRETTTTTTDLAINKLAIVLEHSVIIQEEQWFDLQNLTLQIPSPVPNITAAATTIQTTVVKPAVFTRNLTTLAFPASQSWAIMVPATTVEATVMEEMTTVAETTTAKTVEDCFQSPNLRNPPYSVATKRSATNQIPQKAH